MELIKIDNEGFITARELYEFLELNKAVFARWTKTNIEDNEFYSEGVDWQGFNIVLNGNNTKEYKLTIDFSKHLCMLSRSAKGRQGYDFLTNIDKPKELAPISKESHITNTVSSRKVAVDFNKEHKHILRDIDAIAKDVPSFGLMFIESTEPDSYGRPQRVYHMNRDGWTLLAMGFNGSAAMQWKVKYIAMFNEMEAKALVPQKLPQTYKEALLELASSIGIIEEQTAILQLQKPKVDFADHCLASKDSVLVRDMAKIASKHGIVTGERRLYSKLREWKWVLSNSTKPTQYAVDQGYFEVRQGAVDTSYGTKLTMTTMVTAKGQVRIIDKLRKEVV